MKQTLALALALALAACGGKSTPTAQGPTTVDKVAAPTPLAPGAWEEMKEDARKEFMKKTVVPVMAAKFKAFDPEKFAEVDCETCHGPKAKDGEFEMPSGDLPELDFDHPDPDDKAISEFMAKEVKPTMANLLGMPEYTPDNPKGFGCLECHTMVK